MTPAQHELDEDACCIHCGFDAAEWWHLERQKPKEDREPQPPCERRIRPTVTEQAHGESETAETVVVRGAVIRKKAAKLAQQMIPAMPVPAPEHDQIKRDAYQLARANRHKPWARRYLKSISRGGLWR